MSRDLHASGGWNRVSRRTPCPVCSRPDWCGVSTDGMVACCMRVESGRALRNGGWLHRLTDKPSYPSTSIHLINGPMGLAPPHQRDLVYRALVAELGLHTRHRDHLLNSRGLPIAALDGFASTPPRDLGRRRRIADRVIDRLGNADALHGVPGFYLDQGGQWVCRATAPGVVVPVPDPAGNIQAFQVRHDRPGAAGPRYIWYSSRGKPGGISPGARVACWKPGITTGSQIFITEGSLKAAVAAWHLGAHVIGVPGVSNWRRALDLLTPKVAVAIAYDADADTNPLVARQQLELSRAIFWAGHPVAIATWDSRYKGIDDAILAGLSINLNDWPLASCAPPRRRGGALPATALREEARQ